MKLQTAQRIAQRLVQRMEPYCHRIEVAGSIRRQVPDVGDIEIVAIPKTYQTKIEKKQGDMFGPQYDMITRSELVDGALVSIPNLRWVKTNFSVKHLTSASAPKDEILAEAQLEMTDELSEDNFYGRNRKHWKGISSYKEELFQVDLFLTDQNRFGATYLIRTGSDKFNLKLISELKQRGYGFANGDFVRYQNAARDVVADTIYCPDEVVIFKQLGMSVVPPEERDGNYKF